MADEPNEPIDEYRPPDEPATSELSPVQVPDVDDPPVDAQPSPEDIESKYKASSTEARRQKERADAAEAQLAQSNAKMQQFQAYLQQQQMSQNYAAQQQHMQQQFPPGGLNEEETAALTDAYQTGDNERIRQLEALKEQRLGQKIQFGILSQLGTEAARAARAQQSVQFLSAQAELSDQNNPIYRKAVEIYNLKLSNPQAQVFEQAVGQLPDGSSVNPHMFKEAFLEAKAYEAQTPYQQALDQSIRGDFHSEGGGGGRKLRQPVNPITGANRKITNTGAETEAQLRTILPRSIQDYVSNKRQKFDSSYNLKKWWSGLTEDEKENYRRQA